MWHATPLPTQKRRLIEEAAFFIQLSAMKTFTILTIFPHIFDSYINESILKRAQEKKKILFKILNIRDHAKDKHQQVDDKPYGGGAGMLMKVEPIFLCLKKNGLIVYDAKSKQYKTRSKKTKIILLDARGERFTQARTHALCALNDLVFICGHYEGVDERVAKFVDMKISLGDFVLTGGELPALCVIDSIARLIPGVLGKDESLREESFVKEGYGEYPQYTRPEIFEPKKGVLWRVPNVLISGHHQKIQEWKKKMSYEGRTFLPHGFAD